MRTARWRQVALLAILASQPVAGAGQPVSIRPDTGLRWAPSSAVAPMVVRGIVIDVVTGEGLEAVQVYPSDGHVGALTDLEGRFELVMPDSGRYELVADRIGFSRTADTIVVRADGGIFAQFAMTQIPLSVCGLIVCAWPGCESGVRVEVRDLDTGRAPAGEVTLTVSSEGQTRSTRGLAPARDTAYLQSRFTTPEYQEVFDSAAAAMPVRLHTGGDVDTYGPFEVSVSSSQYHDWTASNVWLSDRACLPRVSPLLRVWLLPSDGAR